MGNLSIFVPTAHLLGHEPSEEDIERAYVIGAFQTMSIVGTGQLPEGCSPLQWLWAAHRGNTDILTESVFRKFLPDFVHVIGKLRSLDNNANGSPDWLRSFWDSFVESPVCSQSFMTRDT